MGTFTQEIILKNKEKLIIRQAQPSDALDINNYIQKVVSESDFLATSPDDDSVSEENQKKYLEKRANSDGNLFLVGIIGDQIVGMLNFKNGNKIRTQHAGEFGMTVARANWGIGIGSCLLETLIAWAKIGRQIRKINLRVRTDNVNAIKLYEKYGFKNEGLITREICIKNKFYDHYSMGVGID
ncbi:MAG: GNAT family protein [Candidatus Vogelbacteria bacterium]|nr:GNAT family protein [Candidatus Vogelbacteria bacterium]